LGQPIAGQVFATEEVTCTTWNQFAAEHRLANRVTMMKIDVEGWESRVLEGGRANFTQPDAPTLQIEFTETAAVAAGTSCADLYQTLVDLGYYMFIYDRHQRMLLPAPPRERYPYMNLIATKNPDLVVSRVRERP
jgi:hypothetical protein